MLGLSQRGPDARRREHVYRNFCIEKIVKSHTAEKKYSRVMAY
jgi:hypothetical protein